MASGLKEISFLNSDTWFHNSHGFLLLANSTFHDCHKLIRVGLARFIMVCRHATVSGSTVTCVVDTEVEKFTNLSVRTADTELADSNWD